MLTLTLDSRKTQIQTLAEQLGVSIVAPDYMDCPPEMGSGYLKAYYLPNELTVTVYIYSLRLAESAPFQTVNPVNSGVYCLFINLTEETIEKSIADETIAISQQSPNGIFYYAPGNQIVQQNPAHRLLRFVVITFTNATFQQLLSDEQRTQVTPSVGGFMFLDVEPTMQPMLQQLAQEDDAVTLSTLKKYNLTLELTTTIFEKVIQRRFALDTKGLYEQDIQKLFQVRNYLITHLQQSILLPGLAAMVGFSETKLKRLFPRLFGRSVHQYQQFVRMEQARELLLSRQFSVSEVGYQVGYTNMTHFAEAFQKHHNVKPREFLKTVQNKMYTRTESVSQ